MHDPHISHQAPLNQPTRHVVRVLKIFLSSPSDVATERQLIKKVVDTLNTISFINEHVLLKLYAYEQDVPPATGKEPQKIIDQYMPMPDQVDIFICLLWRHMGTPFRDETTGQRYLSGTEYEFLCAYQANLKTQCPAILLYRCTRGTASIPPDPAQYAHVQAFFGRFSGDNPDFKGLYKIYAGLEEFEHVLFQDLLAIVRELIKTDKPQLFLQSTPPPARTNELTEPFARTNIPRLGLSFISQHHQKAIIDLCFAADLPCCISVAHDYSLVFYNLERQQRDFILSDLSDNIQAIAYHPGASLLVGVNQRGDVTMWDSRTYQKKYTLFAKDRYLSDVAFSPDGMLLCAVSRTGNGWCWRTDGWEMCRVVCQFDDAASSLAFNPDAAELAIACINGVLLVQNFHNWNQITKYKFSREITRVRFIPGQSMLAIGFEHGEIQLWDYKRALLLASFIHHRERITDLAVLRNGQLLFSSSTDHCIVVWDIENRIFLCEIPTENEVPVAIALDPKETILAAGTTSGHILWYTVRLYM